MSEFITEQDLIKMILVDIALLAQLDIGPNLIPPDKHELFTELYDVLTEMQVTVH